MRNKRLCNALCASGFLFLLCVSCLFFRQSEISAVELENTQQTVQSEKKQNTVASWDVSGAISMIMELGTRDFFSGYPVDQGFLMWVSSNYGEAVVADIAYSLFQGNFSSDLWYQYSGNTMHVLWMEYCKDLQYSSYRYKDVIWMENKNDSTIRIDFIGDINFDEDWYTTKKMDERQNGIYDCLSKEIFDELNGADLTVINNEFTYGDKGTAIPGKAYTFRAKEERVELLHTIGTDLATLANNHLYDFGEEGLLETIRVLEDAGIATVGAGKNLDEATRVQYYVVGGRKIAFVNATQIEKYYRYTKAATETEAGVLKTTNIAPFLKQIKEARANADYVITCVHWGTEGVNNYGEDQKLLATEFVNAGVDAIIGGHSHRLQGVSFIEDVPVAYGLGNFWFSTGSLYTTIAQIQIDEKGQLSLAMLPCLQSNLTTRMLTTEEEVKRFYHYLADVSTEIAIDAEGRFHKKPEELWDGLLYTSERRYCFHVGNYDLDDYLIDIVGNRE